MTNEELLRLAKTRGKYIDRWTRGFHEDLVPYEIKLQQLGSDSPYSLPSTAQAEIDQIQQLLLRHLCTDEQLAVPVRLN